MSRALKSDELKTNKQETPVLRSGLALTKNVLQKKQNASRDLKASTDFRESKPVTDEKEGKKGKKIKVVNGPTRTHKNANLGVNRTQLQAKTIGNREVKKLIPQESNSVSQQKRIRAKQLPSSSNVKTGQKQLSTTTTNNVKIEKKSVYRKQNAVLDTPHNVTVCSPPPKKKNYNDKTVNEDKQREEKDKEKENTQLKRKESRTLAPDEIVILKKETSNVSSDVNIHKENSDKDHTLTIDLRRAVAFEVKFQNQAKNHISNEKLNTIDGLNKNDEDVNYSDDFESYESDFETESSTKSESPNSTSKESDEEVANQNDFLNNLISNKSEQEDDSQVTQIPITEIQNDKERKLDSGHYDMNSCKLNGIKSPDTSVQYNQSVTESLELFTLGMSEQLDSGISAHVTSIPVSDYNKNVIEITYGGYKDFYNKPIINQRGSELMTKIQFDILSFTLVDLKPISYDIFMQTFGKLNTNQNFTQTQATKMNVEQQTEDPDTRSVWTQHPAIFDQEIFRNADKNEVHNERCCGEIVNEDHNKNFESYCDLEKSLDALKQLHNESFNRNYKTSQKQQRRPINFEHLSSFLLQSSFLIDQILGSSNINTNDKSTQRVDSNENDRALKRICEKSFYMDTNILNSLQISKLFANNKYNLLITVHESLPDTNVYSSDFSNLLMVWSTTACTKPLRLLTTWSQVSKVEISNDSLDIIVAALRDGSIALWDLRETNSFCSKLDGSLTHFAATQSIIPSSSGEKNNSKLIMDLGACLDVKCFRSQSNHMLIPTIFPKTQFVSLHDSGIVTVWTLVPTSELRFFDETQKAKYEKLKYSSKFTHTFDYTSPWARVKLTQSSTVNIREHLEKKSHHLQTRFDKTKALFQKNIYSDETLKELGNYASDVGQQGLRFTSLECGSENVFICTNRNYILMCSKTLKIDKLKRIVINESQFLFPTALKLLTNEHFLAVGLSNGEVMILNCQLDKILQINQITKKLTHLESTTTDTNSILDDMNITGKSCAIQNIILNVQKSYVRGADLNQEYRPSTAACITLIESKKKPFELRILDQQVILSGSVLRKNLIKSLELSSDGWYLFALANGRIRIYDFYLDQEISYEENHETGKIIDIATGRCGCNENNLMILKPNTGVQVHILNKLASYNIDGK